jgi:hypothetical protein
VLILIAIVYSDSNSEDSSVEAKSLLGCTICKTLVDIAIDNRHKSMVRDDDLISHYHLNVEDELIKIYQTDQCEQWGLFRQICQRTIDIYADSFYMQATLDGIRTSGDICKSLGLCPKSDRAPAFCMNYWQEDEKDDDRRGPPDYTLSNNVRF